MIELSGFTQVETEEGIRLAKDLVNKDLKLKSFDHQYVSARVEKVQVYTSVQLSVGDRKLEAGEDTLVQLSGIFGPTFKPISRLDPLNDKPMITNPDTYDVMIKNITYSATMEYEGGTTLYRFVTDGPVLLSNGLRVS